MAVKTETRVIKIDVNATEAAKATKRLNAHMKRLNRSATSVTESIFRFQMGMQALASFLAIREIADLADKYTILHGRLKLVIKSQEDLAIVQRDLNKLAGDVFTDVGSIAKAYTDLQLKVKGVRLTHQDTIKVVRTMAQSFRVSGSTAKEASSATLQLMQALSSGKLQGDELRTLRESNILLLDAIVEQYRRVNKIQKDVKLDIKELGAEGKITPEIILDALKRSAPKFEAQAKKLSITFENIFVRARSTLSAFLGELEAKGNLKPLKDALLGVADAADSAAVGFGSFVAVFAATKVAQGIRDTAKAIMSLRIALTTTTLAAITVAIGIVVGYMYEISKTATKVNGKLYETRNLWFEMAKLLKQDIVQYFNNISSAMSNSEAAVWAQFTYDWIVNILKIIKKLFNFLFSLPDLFIYTAEAAVKSIGKISETLFILAERFSKLFAAIEEGGLVGGAKAAVQILAGGFDFATKIAEIKNIEEEFSKNVKEALSTDWIGQGIAGLEGFLWVVNKSAPTELGKLGQSWMDYFKNLKERAAANSKAISEENKKVTTNMLNDVKTKVENTNSFIKDGLTNYINEIKDWGKQVTDMANKTMKSFEDAIVNAVTTGKLQFKDLADSILQDLARIMVRQHISGPIAQALASAFSPTPTTNKTVSAPIPQVTAPSPTIALSPPVFGGAMPPFMDSPGVSQVSSMRPSISAPRIMVPQQKTNVSIQNFSGQQAQVSETVSADGSKNIKVTIGQVVKEGLAAGQYDRVLSGAFGINRKGSR